MKKNSLAGIQKGQDLMPIKRLKVIFFLFVFIQGIFYLFLIPPGQSPDEWHHFGYGVVLSKKGKPTPEAYEDVNKKIIELMATFHAWKYQNVPRPDVLPDKYSEIAIFGGASHSLFSLSHRAPLYYVISSFIIKGTKKSGILNQFYLIRGFSLILFLLSIYFTYLSARIIFRDNPLYCLAAVSFVSFLPQFVIISTSVNPVNLAVLIVTIFFYLIILALFKKKILLIGLFGPLIIAIGFYSHRTALFMIPPFLVLLLIFFVNSLKNKITTLKNSIIILGIIILFLVLYFVASLLFPGLLNSVDDSSVSSRITDLDRFFNYITTAHLRSFSVSLNDFFKTFWYFSGWLRFGYPPDIYSILTVICLLSFLGLVKYSYHRISKINYNKSIDLPSFLILISAGLPIILGTIIRNVPLYYAPQGRYLFPAISALAVLFVLGIKEIVPKKFENWLPVFVIVGFIVLNIYTIFNSLIRVFYYFTNA